MGAGVCKSARDRAGAGESGRPAARSSVRSRAKPCRTEHFMGKDLGGLCWCTSGYFEVDQTREPGSLPHASARLESHSLSAAWYYRGLGYAGPGARERGSGGTGTTRIARATAHSTCWTEAATQGDSGAGSGWQVVTRTIRRRSIPRRHLRLPGHRQRCAGTGDLNAGKRGYSRSARRRMHEPHPGTRPKWCVYGVHRTSKGGGVPIPAGAPAHSHEPRWTTPKRNANRRKQHAPAPPRARRSPLVLRARRGGLDFVQAQLHRAYSVPSPEDREKKFKGYKYMRNQS